MCLWKHKSPSHVQAGTPRTELNGFGGLAGLGVVPEAPDRRCSLELFNPDVSIDTHADEVGEDNIRCGLQSARWGTLMIFSRLCLPKCAGRSQESREEESHYAWPLFDGHELVTECTFGKG